MNKEVGKKAKEMTKHTEEFRKEFQLGKPETVIQNYGCSLNGLNIGTMYVSQNYVCFKSSVGSKTERLPFAKIVSVDFAGSLGKQINIKNEQKEFKFSSFAPKHAKEAYVLISYLWKNPPNYVDAEVIKQHEEDLKRIMSESSKQPEPVNNTQDQQVVQRPKVDVAAGDMLLAIALETDNMQDNILKNVAEQGEIIDRIEDNVERIQGNLKRADHVMKGIESIGYYMFGGSNKKELKDKREKSLKDRTIKVATGIPPVVEVEILYKYSDDSLTPAILVLNIDDFKVVNPENDKPIEKSTNNFSYANVEKIVMRARHEHMDVRFTGKLGRIRLMSSYCQAITNIIFTHCKEKNQKITVEFEPGVVKFDYEDSRISRVPPRQRGGKGAFNIHETQKTSGLLTTVTQETRDDMDKLDAKLDMVHDAVVRMESKGRALNEEVDRQIEQLNRIEGKVDGANEKTKNLNQRIDKKLD